MRKFPLWCLICLLLFSGCSDARKEEQESIKTMKAILMLC